MHPFPPQSAGELGWVQSGAQGGCAPAVCPSWKVFGVEVEHADLLAPAWAGCLLTCCQHRQCLCWSLPSCALPFLAGASVFFPQSQYLRKDLGGFAMLSTLDMSAPSTVLPVSIHVTLRSALWGFPAMPQFPGRAGGAPVWVWGAAGLCGVAWPWLAQHPLGHGASWHREQMGRWSWVLSQVSGYDKVK